MMLKKNKKMNSQLSGNNNILILEELKVWLTNQLQIAQRRDFFFPWQDLYNPLITSQKE